MVFHQGPETITAEIKTVILNRLAVGPEMTAMTLRGDRLGGTSGCRAPGET
jgi:hypothetical protein